MITKQAGRLIAIATIVGFVGDIILQIGTHVGLGGTGGWGLNEYFIQHGRVESTFIAGGMLALFYLLYALTGLPFNIFTMIIWGIILDLMFRVFNIFPSLKGYYNHLNYFWSAVWGAIPMVIPLVLYKLMDKSFVLL